ncbi:Putative Genome maintenance protein [Aspergillus calidoustus]|uniref:Mitochondrial genome maintenance protein MGM101 n=1 Tax=Aspergillus calidoustus TaxID=454130 RepID=A0A0U5FT11_ASPCI|nr:Putative Genome maintenance protein [Aspergillus calidoustus]
MAFLRSLQATEPLLQRLAVYRSTARPIASSIPISNLSRATGARYFSKPTSARAQNTTTPSPTTPKPAPSSPAPSAAAANNNNAKNHPTTPNISKTGLDDKPLELDNPVNDKIDWTRSFHGLSAEPFPREIADILLAETDPEEVEIKPDGILYLPEIKYRRILNKAFGPGGWGLAPRSESIVTPKTVTREYALVCHGRLVSVARGEQDYFSPDGIPTATEGCRSNALVRCCKDLGIASELWDPRWIRKFKAQYTREVWVEHVVSKKKNKIWTRKDDPVSYPWKETK